jgi:ribulose bisphosphate carboxylase small subunit
VMVVTAVAAMKSRAEREEKVIGHALRRTSKAHASRYVRWSTVDPAAKTVTW